jgi:putative DNA primase/helicase
MLTDTVSLQPLPQPPAINAESFTDMENAKRFAAEHGAEVRYLSRWRRWLVWDGRRWRDDDTAGVQSRAKATVAKASLGVCAIGDEDKRNKMKRLALASQRAGRINGLIELARSEPGISITPDQLDADPWLLNVENGTLDLRTGELHAHNPAALITKLAPVTYNAEATCPLWEAFLKRIMAGNDALIRYVQKVIGYALTGDAREQCFFILHGTGANGKSTLTTAVANAVGGYAQHTPTQTLLVKRGDGIPNDVARLHGARLVTAAEAECQSQLAEALVKQLTGGDKVTARFLHGEFFEFVPTFKVFLAVNHKPDIRGTDHAIWRRVRLIPFDVTIPDGQQDKGLPGKLEAERQGILRWAVEGCLAWQREGLETPEAVKLATADYHDEMDVVGAFIDQRCIRDSEAETETGRLYDRYAAGCKVQGDKPMSRAEFGARLAEKGFTPYRTKKGRGWRGLGLAVTE